MNYQRNQRYGNVKKNHFIVIKEMKTEIKTKLKKKTKLQTIETDITNNHDNNHKIITNNQNKSETKTVAKHFDQI